MIPEVGTHFLKVVEEMPLLQILNEVIWIRTGAYRDLSIPSTS